MEKDTKGDYYNMDEKQPWWWKHQLDDTLGDIESMKKIDYRVESQVAEFHIKTMMSKLIDDLLFTLEYVHKISMNLQNGFNYNDIQQEMAYLIRDHGTVILERPNDYLPLQIAKRLDIIRTSLVEKGDDDV